MNREAKIEALHRALVLLNRLLAIAKEVEAVDLRASVEMARRCVAERITAQGRAMH